MRILIIFESGIVMMLGNLKQWHTIFEAKAYSINNNVLHVNVIYNFFLIIINFQFNIFLIFFNDVNFIKCFYGKKLMVIVLKIH